MKGIKKVCQLMERCDGQINIRDHPSKALGVGVTLSTPGR